MIDILGKNIVFRINRSWYVFPVVHNDKVRHCQYEQTNPKATMQGKVVEFTEGRFFQIEIDGFPIGSRAEIIEECIEIVKILD